MNNDHYDPLIYDSNDDTPTKDEAEYDELISQAQSNAAKDPIYSWRYSVVCKLQFKASHKNANPKVKRIYKKFKLWTDNYIKSEMSCIIEQNLLDSDPHAYYGVHPSMFH